METKTNAKHSSAAKNAESENILVEWKTHKRVELGLVGFRFPDKQTVRDGKSY